MSHEQCDLWTRKGAGFANFQQKLTLYEFLQVFLGYFIYYYILYVPIRAYIQNVAFMMSDCMMMHCLMMQQCMMLCFIA